MIGRISTPASKNLFLYFSKISLVLQITGMVKFEIISMCLTSKARKSGFFFRGILEDSKICCSYFDDFIPVGKLLVANETADFGRSGVVGEVVKNVFGIKIFNFIFLP